MSHRSRQLRVSSLARVEGEGALHVVVADGQVESAQLQIYEPPRFFEAFLRGRAFTEPVDITARICGICPVAYQTSAWNAIEDACGIAVDGRIAALRRLLYCGEWISSHALHIYLLHAPDFLGYPDAVALARADRATVERGLTLKKAGNAILEVVGGRAIHPVNPRVGGFHRAPTADELKPLAEQLRRALDDALATVSWVAGFEFPELELEHTLVAARDAERYAIERGDEVASSVGHVFPPSAFPDHVVEHQVPHSTALHAKLDGQRYLTGPLARYTLNGAQLSPLARQAAAAAGLGAACRNPFRSVVVRAVEVVYAIDEALRIISNYQRPEPAAVEVPPRAGVGHGVSEAPRGLLYHRYRLDSDGMIQDAVIVPPTAQNQAAIEDDLRAVVGGHLDLDDAALTALCERTIRNYDPCISCSTHFLTLDMQRR
jgi:coenzyme F420-reducing hydrogenase alpha subunit